MPTHADYAIVFVTDMARSVRFYKDVLGLTLRFETPDWTEFESGSTTIALHGKTAPRSTPVEVDPRAGECRLGFNVPDIEARIAEIEKAGARIARRPTKSEAERIILATVLDPDGLPITIAQSLR